MTRRHVVIVGAGQAGRRTAETLRELDPGIAVTLLGEESHPPYDRPPLSKAVLTGDPAPETLFARSKESYAEAGIVLRTGAAARRLDRAARQVTLSDGTVLDFDILVLATGSRPRRLSVPGADHPFIHYLRTLDDAQRLGAALRRAKQVAIIGGGLIGLEVAAAARALGCAVIVLEAADRLLGRSLPPEAASIVAELHRDHGVTFRLGCRLTAVGHGRDGRLELAVDGASIPADIAVASIGAVPETTLLEGSDLIAPGGILAGADGRTADPAIYAAGEVAFAEEPYSGQRLRLESWQMAQHQPVAVARAICGQPPPMRDPPWFWSDQYDWNIQVLGTFTGEAPLLRRQESEGRITIAEVTADGQLRAAFITNNGRNASLLRRAMQRGQPLQRDSFADPVRPIAFLSA